MTTVLVQYDNIAVNEKVYVSNGTTDCTAPEDGWYSTATLAESTNSVFRIENGVIVEIASCEENTTTTTTTSTTLVTTAYCFTGIYTDPDPVHPLGGVIIYVNEFGGESIETGIFDTDFVNINAVSIVSSIGVVPCP